MKTMRWALAAAVLCTAIAVGVLFAVRADAAGAPSLFHNDESWYRDGRTGLVVRDGAYFVPVDLFGMFRELELSVDGRYEEFMVYNRNTGAYISVLTGEGLATINGQEEIPLVLFREGGSYYVDAALFCGVLSLELESAPSSAAPGVSVRIGSGRQSKTLAQLLMPYDSSAVTDSGETSEGPVVVPPVTTADRTERQIYLTFNTFSPAMLPRILSLLDERGVRAAFFFTGEEIAETPQLAIAVAARGHTVALTAAAADSAADFLAAVEAANDTLCALTKLRARVVQLPPRGVRGGLSEADTEEILARGYVIWDWSYDVPDSAGYTVETVVRLCREQLLDSEVCVFRFGGNYVTSLVLPELIDFIKENPSYSLRAVSECARAARRAP